MSWKYKKITHLRLATNLSDARRLLQTQNVTSRIMHTMIVIYACYYIIFHSSKPFYEAPYEHVRKQVVLVWYNLQRVRTTSRLHPPVMYACSKQWFLKIFRRCDAPVCWNPPLWSLFVYSGIGGRVGLSPESLYYTFRYSDLGGARNNLHNLLCKLRHDAFSSNLSASIISIFMSSQVEGELWNRLQLPVVSNYI